MTTLYSLSPQEQADINFIYGFCNGNACAAAREYAERYPSRAPVKPNTFTKVFQALREHGINKVQESRAGFGNLKKQEKIIDFYKKNPSMSYRKIAANLGISLTLVCRVLNDEKEGSQSRSATETSGSDDDKEENDSEEEVIPISRLRKRKRNSRV